MSNDYEMGGVRVERFSDEAIDKLAHRVAQIVVARMLRVFFVSGIVGVILFGTLGTWAYSNRGEMKRWFNQMLYAADSAAKKVSPLR
jgi:hypothetical protein